MNPGVYIVSGNEKRFIASLDELVYGEESDRAEISHDILNIIRDVAVELIGNDDDVAIAKLTIYVVQ